MQAISEAVAIERRQEVSEQRDVWEDLTLAQKFAASSLTQFGYELAFVRDCHGNSLAVLLCNNNIATISKAGEINTAPNIKLRN
ncbi:hypothetical protein [Litorilituus sediminis]|uniref:Uncharacterized protein n=1 Tax=Litorilituus sediminis TaxID=718192 RepID=A0A4P6P794_9GAMM|nr:hypothetical protein [Litorilituus sediminis]QBG36079.1 hypothetical protein EMK97_10340 [Litorilituus sediminis]